MHKGIYDTLNVCIWILYNRFIRRRFIFEFSKSITSTKTLPNKTLLLPNVKSMRIKPSKIYQAFTIFQL